ISKLFQKLDILSGTGLQDTSGVYYNPFDDGAPGTEYIQNVSDLPQYTWTGGQPDDYGASDMITPETLTM
ncbi:hypothetical protein GUITHDRAFT_152798, partial [Guillardia theta CCMP2712]